MLFLLCGSEGGERGLSERGKEKRLRRNRMRVITKITLPPTTDTHTQTINRKNRDGMTGK